MGGVWLGSAHRFWCNAQRARFVVKPGWIQAQLHHVFTDYCRWVPECLWSRYLIRKVRDLAQAITNMPSELLSCKCIPLKHYKMKYSWTHHKLLKRYMFFYDHLKNKSIWYARKERHLHNLVELILHFEGQTD